MSIPLNISVFLYIGIFLLGTFTCTVYIIKALVEKQVLYKVGSVFISAFLLYSCFEFLLSYFGNIVNSGWRFHICVTLSDIAYFSLVISWLFLLGILSGNQALIKKKLLVTVAAIYGIAVEALIYLELFEDNMKFQVETLDILLINGFHPITLLNFSFSVFLLIWGMKCLRYGICKMCGEKTQKLMVLFSAAFILYLIWIIYWDYSVTVWSEKNLLKFDPILIVFIIVCLASLKMLYNNKNLLVGLNGEKAGLEFDEDHLWKLLMGKYQLTQRETEIIKLVYKGQSNPDIGRHLFIAEDTVKKHLNHIFKKTETKSRYELMNCISEELKAPFQLK